MKYLAIAIMLFFSISIFGQQYKSFKDIPTEILDKLDKMGVDDSTLLNNYESMYLNEVFKNSLKDFDFTGKKVGFITNGDGKKSAYFNMHKKHISNENTPCDNGSLYIFDEAQKKESGGYDAAIVYWRKLVITKEGLVEKLKNGKKKKK